MEKAGLAIIGGTGHYQMEDFKILDNIDMNTPFGKPSDVITLALYRDKVIAFLPRHGAGHRLLPSEIPVKANIWALKKIGVERIIAVSAVGSLKEKIKPRDTVIPNQIIDRTKVRANSYFGNGIVGHLSFADPFCIELSNILYKTAKSLEYKVHRDETYVCMEGPLFSTRAESNLYRSWGGGIIGMTILPEAKLAREAEICYAIIAMSTDYDCWKEGEEDVTIEIVIENLKATTDAAKNIIKKALDEIPEKRECPCKDAARYAIITDKKLIPPSIKESLGLFYGKYWDQST